MTSRRTAVAEGVERVGERRFTGIGVERDGLWLLPATEARCGAGFVHLAFQSADHHVLNAADAWRRPISLVRAKRTVVEHLEEGR